MNKILIPLVNVKSGNASGWTLKPRIDREFIHLDLHWTDKEDPTHTTMIRIDDLKEFLNDQN